MVTRASITNSSNGEVGTVVRLYQLAALYLRRLKPGALAIVLILIASLRIVSTYRVLSHTTDEPAHLAAGIEWIENGTYTYEDQHPPLARVTGALGVYFAGSRWSRNKDLYDEGFHLLGTEQTLQSRALLQPSVHAAPFFWIGAAAVDFWGLRIGGTRTAVFSHCSSRPLRQFLPTPGSQQQTWHSPRS